MARLMLTIRNTLKSRTVFAICFASLITLTVFLIFFKQNKYFLHAVFTEKSRKLYNFHRLAESATPSSVIQRSPEHVLCVLVPFRNAFDELQEFIPFMSEFLNRQSIKYYFIIANHVPDGNRFNRGAIFNAGFDIISKRYVDCDYIALHDIDLLPLNDEIPYAYPGDDVYHVAHPELHPLGQYYNVELYISGIALISNKQYLRINGFGNNFWGWGDEDRNFLFRTRRNSINRVRPGNLTTNRSNTFKNIHSPYRTRDVMRCGNQIGAGLINTDFQSGLSDLKYELVSERSIKIDDHPLIMFNIRIPCDYFKTPWCKPFCLDSIQNFIKT